MDTNDPIDKLTMEHVNMVDRTFTPIMAALKVGRQTGDHGVLSITPKEIRWIKAEDITHNLLYNCAMQSHAGTFVLLFPNQEWTLAYLCRLNVNLANTGHAYIMLERYLIPQGRQIVLPRLEDLPDEQIL